MAADGRRQAHRLLDGRFEVAGAVGVLVHVDRGLEIAAEDFGGAGPEHDTAVDAPRES